MQSIYPQSVLFVNFGAKHAQLIQCLQVAHMFPCNSSSPCLLSVLDMEQVSRVPKHIVTLVSLPSQVQMMSGSHSMVQHTRATVS